MAVEGRSPEDLTELALRVTLFGDNNPLGLMSFMANSPNPFDQVAPHRLAEEIVGGVVRVLLTETLVSSGRAERIKSFRLGPAHRGRRRLAMSWLPRQRYTSTWCPQSARSRARSDHDLHRPRDEARGRRLGIHSRTRPWRDTSVVEVLGVTPSAQISVSAATDSRVRGNWSRHSETYPKMPSRPSSRSFTLGSHRAPAAAWWSSPLPERLDTEPMVDESKTEDVGMDPSVVATNPAVVRTS